MPKVKHMRRGRMKGQEPPAPILMPLRRQRQQVTFPLLVYCDVHPVTSLPVFTQQQLDLLRMYRREIAACDERACTCTCHCHSGGEECYLENGEGNTDPSRFHYRKPNTAHKRAHRECPKEGREHNRR